jgi:hypothetical protein
MNTRSACEYTMFAPAQRLRNWLDQRPSNQGDLDSSVTGEDARVLHGGGPASDLIFVLYILSLGEISLCNAQNIERYLS